MAPRSLDGKHVNINWLPDSCPLCHSAVQPIETATSSFEEPFAEIVFKCPNQKCSRLFIGRYSISTDHVGNRHGRFTGSVPATPVFSAHSTIINNLSPAFAKIFAQAEEAEARGLDEIAGVGYRRSLEFLIKDYLIFTYTDAETKEQIKQQALASCINNYVKNENIKEVSRRAVWLGNDETHYVRKWEEKDVRDLKKLISMTVNWIELEQHTADLQREMPVGR